jgi:hypothetical protein
LGLPEPCAWKPGPHGSEGAGAAAMRSRYPTKTTGTRPKITVSVDGRGVVGHAGTPRCWPTSPRLRG